MISLQYGKVLVDWSRRKNAPRYEAILRLIDCQLLIFIAVEDYVLNVSNTAPDFSGMIEDGIQKSLSDFLATNYLVLFFYSKDFTAG